ncbi:flavodoxin [Oceanobacter mangrovi]|uniref:flavodoxin n=1 Tax=Oceanobacter mangrovi TaxID=2862510 RepID=UPI001C8E448C|nr:flavodoxin [Oceanobacter mangrovi]
MANIGMYVGSSNGITMAVAKQIKEALTEHSCDVLDLEDDYLGFDEMLEYDVLIFGCSTWGSGEVQFNWVEPLQDLYNDKPDFSGATIALFGAGDCKDHGEQFVSALGLLYDKFSERGARFIAPFSTDGYTYQYSNAVRDGQFVGFPFDQVNEKDKTAERLERWLQVLKAELAE